MRKLMMIVVVMGLLLLAGCPNGVELPPVVDLKGTVRILTVEGFKTTTYLGSMLRKASMVPGFEHQYDTCFLMVTNQGSTDQEVYKNVTEPLFPDVSLSKGLYSFYVNSGDNPPIISFNKSFIAFSQPDSVRAGAEYILELQEEVKQALVLVDANTVDEAPNIEVGLTTLPMQRYGDFWYAYILAPAALHAKIGGADIIKGTPFKQGEIYVWSAVKGRISTKDGFDNVIYI